jgi:hypothetical protein
MAYIKPSEVISPKAHWSLIDVLLDRGPGDCAYALGSWDGERRIGFRWNGTAESELGNPQSRGLPTWTMLDPEIHRQVLEQLPPDKLAIARSFLGINLMIEGPTPPDSPQGDLVFYDFFQTPPVLVKLPSNALRDAVGRLEITDSDCVLLAMRHRRIITDVAAGLLAKGESKLRDDGRFRLIEISAKQLQKVANQLSTDVLAMAAAARWA